MDTHKKILFLKIKEELSKMLELYKLEMKAAQEEANYHKGAMESRYDTFKEEAQSLKDGLARQYAEVASVMSKISALDYNIERHIDSSGKIKIGSIVKTVESSFASSTVYNYFILHNIGIVALDSTEYITIGLDSPLAKSLIGKEVGDEINFLGKFFEITEII